MSNALTVLYIRLRLAEEGKLATIPGQFIIVEKNGVAEEVPEPEPILTFQLWKKRGRCVRKGEHALAKADLWIRKAGKKRTEEETLEDKEDNEGYRDYVRKTSYLYSYAQTDPFE